MSSSFQRIVIHSKRLDGSSIEILGARLEAAWRSGARTVALDLSNVDEMNSLGISALIAAYHKRPAGARIVLCGLNDYVRDIVEVTQLHRIFDVFDSGEAADLALSA